MFSDGEGSFGLIEMDEAASDVASGRIILRNVAREAGIAMSTGEKHLNNVALLALALSLSSLLPRLR